MAKGLEIKLKQKESAPREADLSTTSRARRALEEVRKSGDAKAAAEMESKVGAAYPDMLLTRRVVR